LSVGIYVFGMNIFDIHISRGINEDFGLEKLISYVILSYIIIRNKR